MQAGRELEKPDDPNEPDRVDHARGESPRVHDVAFRLRAGTPAEQSRNHRGNVALVVFVFLPENLGKPRLLRQDDRRVIGEKKRADDDGNRDRFRGERRSRGPDEAEKIQRVAAERVGPFAHEAFVFAALQVEGAPDSAERTDAREDAGEKHQCLFDDGGSFSPGGFAEKQEGGDRGASDDSRSRRAEPLVEFAQVAHVDF